MRKTLFFSLLFVFMLCGTASAKEVFYGGQPVNSFPSQFKIYGTNPTSGASQMSYQGGRAMPIVAFTGAGGYRGSGTENRSDAIYAKKPGATYYTSIASGTRWHQTEHGRPWDGFQSATTNHCLQNRDGSNAAWTKTNMEASKVATGIDGAANSGTSITATANNGKIIQAITLNDSQTKTFSVFVKRLVGSGNVYLTMDNGTNTYDITSSISTGSWYTGVTTQGNANPSVGIILGTSGDAVEFDFAQLEPKAYNSQPIATAGSVVLMSADQYQIAFADVSGLSEVLYGAESQGSLALWVYPKHTPADCGFGGLIAPGVTDSMLYFTSAGRLASSDGSVTTYELFQDTQIAKDTETLVICQWGYLVGGVSHFRIGIGTDAGFRWGIDHKFDSYYDMATNLVVFAAGVGRLSTAWGLYDRIVSDAEITSWGWDTTEDTYGVTWDESADYYTRLGAISSESKGSSPGDSKLPLHRLMRRCVLSDAGEVIGYLDEDNSVLYEDGTSADIDGSDGSVDGQVMVEIPRFYYRYAYSGTTHSWEISRTEKSGFSIHPAFMKNGIEVPVRYIGAYEACLWDDSDSAYEGYGAAPIDTANDVLSSVSGVKPHTNDTRDQYRQVAGNRGTGWRQLDFYLLSAVQLLYVIEYADFNVQDAIGNGNCSYSGWNYTECIAPAGLSNSDGNGTNASNSAFSGVTTDGSQTNGEEVSEYCSYRGIENLWGSVLEFVDGFNIHNFDDNAGISGSSVFVSNNDSQFADDTATNYSLFGYLVEDDGYVDALIQSGTGFLPTGNTGASNTHLGDYFYTSFDGPAPPFDDWRVACVGGVASYGAKAGVFFAFSTYDSSDGSTSIGGRLCF